MAEELFDSTTSPVPDELWKDAKSPVQRQLAAVEFWDEMNGRKEAAVRVDDAFTGGARVAEILNQHPEALGAGIGGALMGAKSLYDTGGVGPAGRSRGVVELLAAIAERQKKQELQGGTPGIRDRLMGKQLALAEYDRKHRIQAALRQSGIGAAAGGATGHYKTNPELQERIRRFLPGGGGSR